MAKVIAIANQKGGCGKTSVAANLGIGLAMAGKKVCLIDADPQGSLTVSLGYPDPDSIPVTLATMMMDIINEEESLSRKGILHHDEGVDLIPANMELSGIEVSLSNVMSREMILKEFLETIRDSYDYILIDCMPSLGIMTINALVSADKVIIPVQAAYLPVVGLQMLLKTISVVKKRLNKSLSVEGILITMVDYRTNYAKDITAMLQESYGNDVGIMESFIPFSVKVAEASSEGISIFRYAPKCKAAEGFSRLTKEVLRTSVEELLGVSNEESAMDIEVVKIQPFRNHPFKVIDDEKMEDLVESIRANGILSPVLIRPIGNDVYEMVSGHRRMHAAILLGMDRIPAIIREMTDDEAIVKMVDANIQREELLPSEKAFAYKMKMDAMKNQGYRSDLTADSKTSCQFGTKSRADQQVSGQVGESARQVQRFIRLTELIPELLEYVDQKRLQFTVAVEISYIDKEVQKWLYEYIKDNGMVRLNQVVLLRAQMKTGAITQAKMISMLNNSQPGKGPATKLTFSEKKLREFFPAHYTSTQMRDVIEDLLSDWKHKQDFEGLNGE